MNLKEEIEAFINSKLKEKMQMEFLWMCDCLRKIGYDGCLDSKSEDYDDEKFEKFIKDHEVVVVIKDNDYDNKIFHSNLGTFEFKDWHPLIDEIEYVPLFKEEK